jgi:hypothetical protein
MILLPWGTQNVTVLEADSGDELARIRFTDDMVGAAFVTDGHVYLGQRTVFRLTPAIASGARASAAHLQCSLGELPGRPALVVDPYQAPPDPASAVNRIRLAWRPIGEGESVSMADDHVYLVFYKLVFALDPASGAVRWAAALDHDVVGSAAVPGGVLVVDDHGGVALLRAQDGVRGSLGEVGSGAVAARVRGGTAPLSAQPDAEPLPLRDQLLAVAASTDSRLVPGRIYAVTALAALPEGEVTGNLVTLCEDRRAPAQLRSASCTALAARTAGPDEVLRALERHAAFLEGTSTPPVGALAQAAQAMSERRAVPALLAHLRDPETPSADLVALVGALAALGVRDAAEPIGDFLRLYHAEDGDPHLTRGLVAAIGAVVTLAGPTARDVVASVANDPLALGDVRSAAQTALAEIERVAEPEPDPADGGAEATAAEGTAEGTGAPPAVTDDSRPEVLTAQLITATLTPVRDSLRACLQSVDSRPTSARAIIRLDGDGAVEGVSVTPSSVEGCVRTILRGVRFPANRRGTRQQVTYTIR